MPKRTMQVEAIDHGTVVDHIPSAVTLRVAELIAEDGDQVFIGVNLKSKKVGNKGVVKIASRELRPATLSRLALLAPHATMCIIRDYQVVAKDPIPVPDSFTDIALCPNANCVTNHERWPTQFDVLSQRPLQVRCLHCERDFPASELAIR
ncbi:MAG: aspartate carbamoyltransferase regulatory subunit [Planctomycetota bacterium]|jgi:aspartate carbamoyltransferase regulatory subunit|nr:aspartate carbamoyltransferase regulatory subunit [Planctomycetota bacterium]